MVKDVNFEHLAKWTARKEISNLDFKREFLPHHFNFSQFPDYNFKLEMFKICLT